MILYELNDEKLYSGQNKQTGKPVTVKGNLKNCHESKCERPFGVQLIPHTNMVRFCAETIPIFPWILITLLLYFWSENTDIADLLQIIHFQIGEL